MFIKFYFLRKRSEAGYARSLSFKDEEEDGERNKKTNFVFEVICLKC
jgi:hypothetical protein